MSLSKAILSRTKQQLELSKQLRCLIEAAKPAPEATPSWQPTFLSWSRTDWAELFVFADRHGMAPLVYRYLEGAPQTQIPEAVKSELLTQRRRQSLRNLHLTGELWTLQELFLEQGAEVISVKGPTLAALVFGDVTNRQFVDLDLLVDDRDLAVCAEILLRRGYRSACPVESIHHATFRRITNVLEFYHREKGFTVELHWRLSVDFLKLDLSSAWTERRLVYAFPAGKPILTFALEPLALYLSVHAAKHCWLKLNWAADIAWLIQSKPNLDWDYLFSLARQQHCERVLKIALVLARDWLEAPLPISVGRLLDQDQSLATIARRIVSWWTLPDTQAPGPISARWTRSRYFFDIQDEWRSRWLYLVRLLLAPNLTDWKFIQLSPRWAGAYAALRPIRFLFDQNKRH